MSADTQLSIAFLISIASISFTAVNFFTSRKKDLKNENEQFIRISVAETKEDIRGVNDKLLGVIEEQIAHGQQIKEIWRRIAKLEEKE